jgi:putative flavoprotein involved in K+ transport
MTVDRQDVLVIGAGQAGLAMGFHLRKAGLRFTIVDAHPRVGDAWRRRWDSLRLFTPRPLCELPGMPMPRRVDYYPAKDQIADYLEGYSRYFDLPVQNDFRVEKLRESSAGFLVEGPAGTIYADRVVIAAGPFHVPRVPECAAALDREVWQGHSSAYRRPSDVPAGDLLIVGGGNSGAQLAEELSVTHRVTFATRGEPKFSPQSLLGISIFRYMQLTGMLRADKDAPVARYAQMYDDTIVGFRLKQLIKKGKLTSIPQAVTDCDGRAVILADGRRIEVASVLWCTGFRPAYDWIKIDGALDDRNAPRHERGVSPVRGLYWLGLPWQNSLNSALVNGVATDAARLIARLSSTSDARP